MNVLNDLAEAIKTLDGKKPNNQSPADRSQEIQQQDI